MNSPSAHLATEEPRWSASGGGGSNCCASASLTSSTSFAMDSLASSHGSTMDQFEEPKRSYSACALSLSDTDLMLGFERKPYRPFRSNEEYLVAMKEDLAEWLNTLYTLDLSADNFLSRLETGVILCKHANSVLRTAREWKAHNEMSTITNLKKSLSKIDFSRDVFFRENASSGSFLARDNVCNFIQWCRRIRIKECLLFETEDLVARKNEKSFVLCLLEVARYGAKFGLLAPTLVQFEQEIDQELEKEQHETKRTIPPPTDVAGSLSLESDAHFDDSPQQQITNNDLESLHEKVVNLLSRCTCPIQFYLEHLSEGKYRIGDTKTLIFVRILRNHVMVRVGGGWDTLEHYLEKHDPCRCRFGHRASASSRVTLNYGQAKSSQMQVTFERPDNSCHPQPRRSLASVNSSPSAAHRIIRPSSSTSGPSSSSDLTTLRRASTSSNDSASSMCSASLASGSHPDSLVSSEHSSLSSNNSLASYQVPILPDRNNNIKGLSNGASKSPAIPHPKPSPKKRILSTPDAFSRIPKSKAAGSMSAMHLRTCPPSFTGTPKALTNAHKIKSTSTLAISQLSSPSSKIPCLGSTNKPRPSLSSRYSTQNIYMAVSQESENDKPTKRFSLTNGPSQAKQRSRASNLNRSKPKSSLELNASNENFYSLSQIDKVLEPVPNKTPKPAHQQHRRHHSSSSLPRVTKSAQNSPYSKRRELPSGALNGSGSAAVSGAKAGSNLHHGKMASKLDTAKRLQGSATSLNSTASTASGSTNSSSSSLHTTLPSTGDAGLRQPLPPKVSSTGGSFFEPKKPFLSSPDKSPSALKVEVCSWLERNHLTGSN